MLPELISTWPPGRSARTHEPTVSARSGYRWMALVEAMTSTPRLEQLRPEHLVEALEALLVAQEPQEPEADLRVVAELLQRDPQELRRAVDDDGADLGVEHPQLQPVEQDAGAARVVDEDVAVDEQVGQLLDGGVEVAVPAVAVDAVVGGAEGVDRLVRPVVVGQRATSPSGHWNGSRAAASPAPWAR